MNREEAIQKYKETLRRHKKRREEYEKFLEKDKKTSNEYKKIRKQK